MSAVSAIAPRDGGTRTGPGAGPPRAARVDRGGAPVGDLVPPVWVAGGGPRRLEKSPGRCAPAGGREHPERAGVDAGGHGVPAVAAAADRLEDVDRADDI